ncbi:Sugar kinase of the NBD/HSP70 family, may contain an N-terminal HTH domain [Bifidobacterium bohemicum]|uniref:ROK family transcriptional regulator n=1 Tax=Bifidobacterium bohemicum DSM 22767 TaxID=1437606 RepID=A0A086ZKA5_9BIFI|nr:ROK family protein [Bifidobacterium bohemicum]KFI46955.1 ROK family transcriptional regulator [Bifidobacterium bohemicum DSM 22767]SCB86116.1 Sugar kinase of the NBD/HSP70 family, may contain an N-terminal HTH domain [Bifidobacterium bohemicum]
MPLSEYKVGVDVGGTSIEGVLVDAQGHMLARHSVGARRGGQKVIEDIVGVVRALADDAKVRRLDGVGVGIPGSVDTKHGVVSDVVNLDIISLPLGPELADLLDGVPVFVENDVNAAALGAAKMLLASDDTVARIPDTVVFVNFGTGLAAGVLRQGRIEHGFSGAFGEIGHLPVNSLRLQCSCGQKGCLETVASGGAVSRLWPQAYPPMPDLLQAARGGDAHAREILDLVVSAIADTIQIVAQSYDPQYIILGGGMTKTGRPFMDVVEAELHRREEHSHFLRMLDLVSRLRLVSKGEPIGALGAALAVEDVPR